MSLLDCKHDFTPSLCIQNLLTNGRTTDPYNWKRGEGLYQSTEYKLVSVDKCKHCGKTYARYMESKMKMNKGGIEYDREDFIAPLSGLLGSKAIDQDGDGFTLTWQYMESGKVLLEVNLYHNTMVASCDLVDGGRWFDLAEGLDRPLKWIAGAIYGLSNEDEF